MFTSGVMSPGGGGWGAVTGRQVRDRCLRRRFDICDRDISLSPPEKTMCQITLKTRFSGFLIYSNEV